MPTGLPPPFQPLFEYMEGVRSVYNRDFMRNGAGKLLMYNSLSVARIGFVKISTTTDPRTDWCGYAQSSTLVLCIRAISTDRGSYQLIKVL